jgi:hypothetical protein
MTDDRFRSRKFRLALGAFATFTLLRIFGLLDQSGYITLAVFALGGYLGANVVQKWTTKDGV